MKVNSVNILDASKRSLSRDVQPLFVNVDFEEGCVDYPSHTAGQPPRVK